MTFKIGTPLLLVVMLFSRPLFAEQMTIDKQINLSPGHRVMAYHISRLSDGDLIVFGSDSELDNRPWATRVSAEGEIRWEFLQGGGDGWNDQSEKGQRFNSVIEFQDHTILFCGTKVTNNRALLLMDHLSVDGKLIDERTIRPEAGHGLLTSASCVWWNNGVALIGANRGSRELDGSLRSILISTLINNNLAMYTLEPISSIHKTVGCITSTAFYATLKAAE